MKESGTFIMLYERIKLQGQSISGQCQVVLGRASKKKSTCVSNGKTTIGNRFE